MSRGGPRAWSGCHIHYHGDQDLLLRDLLAPFLRAHLAAGEIDRFFFVRYALGGPHVRLRCRPAPGADAGEVARSLEAAARSFFTHHPSRQPWPEERTRRRNRAILAADSSEQDDSVYPDESFRAVPFQPETERYGGAKLLPLSLELFTLSSIAAFDTLAGCRASRGHQLNAFFRHLGCQAWGAVASGEELLELLDGMIRPAGEAFPGILARADHTFTEQPEMFTRLLARAAEGEAGVAALAAGSAWLRRRLDGLGEPKRRSIVASHLHMSANRLGLSNPEEAYLYRLLHRAGQALRDSRADLWLGMERPRDGDLAAVVAAALEDFARATVGSEVTR